MLCIQDDHNASLQGSAATAALRSVPCGVYLIARREVLESSPWFSDQAISSTAGQN